MPRTVACLGVSVLVVFLGAGALWAADGSAVSLDLVRDGTPAATIVVAKDAMRSAQIAAAELQYHVRKITGATLPIVDDTRAVAGNRVLVGESQATTSLGLKNDDFAHQEYLIRFQPNTLILMGRDEPSERGAFDYADEKTFPTFTSEQGTCYAVYDFLERSAQVRWYLPTELGLCCPTTKTLQVSGGDVRRSPAMKYRNSQLPGNPYPADLCGDTVETGSTPPPELPLRERMLFGMRHRLGGVLPYMANHSLYGYYDRFWKEGDATPGPAFEEFRPEFFAQGYSGKPPQLCYTNPDLVKQLVQEARDWFDGKGCKVGTSAAGDYFAVVPMDNSQYCKCPRCAALVGSQHPVTRGTGQPSNDAASEYLFGFINEVAREVKKSHPTKRIAALAYGYYAYPPTTVKLESNVSIQLCLLARNIFSPEMQENDRAILDAWTAESVDRPKLLWLYYCFPSLGAYAPMFSGDKQQWRCFPGFFAHTVVQQMATYRKANIGGIYCQPAYLAHLQQSPLMDQVEFYVTWKLADDPTRDGNAMIDEFFERYYGSAAAPMKAFYELVERTYADPANYPPSFKVVGKLQDGDIVIGNHQNEEAAWKYLGTESRMLQLGRLMDEARTAATTEIEKQRVALFDKGIWQYMQAGRKAYLERGDSP